MSSRSEEERERARLERERKRLAKQGKTPPAPPSADDPPRRAPERSPEPMPQPDPAPQPEPTPILEPEPALAQPTMPPAFDPATALVTDYTEQLADHYEPPPPPPQKVSHGQMGKRVALVVGAVALIWVVWTAFGLFQPFAGSGEGAGEVDVTIPKGAEVDQIGELLAEEGVVGSSRNFSWRANWSGDSDKFQAGRYTMAEGMSYAAAIDLLVAGPNTGIVTVTIPEGRSRYEISQQLAEQGRLEGDYMAASAKSSELNPRRFGAPSGTNSLEGFLWPATYEFEDGASVDDLVGQQLVAFKENIGEVNMRFARSKNLTVYDVLIIASLIDREVSVASERRTVASVIYNRLKAGIALGIDATTRFETRNWTEPLTNSVLQDDTPYNTRTRKGLPPGPIGNPGLAAIQAAARPRSTDFLYYVANPCKPGTHTFAKTDAEFQAAVSRYNQAREAAGGKQPTGC